MMRKLIALMAALFVLLSSASAFGWLIYHKPAFRGRIIDAETKAPIEGAVVVVLYWKVYIMGGPGGPRSTILDAKETLTDSNGEFHFPSFIAFTPFSHEDCARFIIYKPGYMSSEGPAYLRGYPLVELFFATDVIGKEGEIRYGQEKWKGILGMTELDRVKTFTERRRTVPSRPFEFSKELPIFFEVVAKEHKYLDSEGMHK